MKLDISSILEFFAAVLSVLAGKITLDQKEFCKWFSRFRNSFVVIYLLLGCMKLTDGVVFFALKFFQEQYIVVTIYVFIVILLTFLCVCVEQRKGSFTADKNYKYKNLGFNIVGALAALMMYVIVCNIIKDFSCLKSFYIEGVVSVFFPACTGLVFAYQSVEQSKDKDEMDHDASIKSINQKFNMLHLFNVFFLASVSTVYILAYTLYCHIYQQDLKMEFKYYFFLTLMLIFFYTLAFGMHRYMKLIFVIMVPVILIAATYWMTWFSMDKAMRICQWGFLLLHSVIYAVLVLKNENIFIIEKSGGEEEGNCIQVSKWRIRIGQVLFLILLFIIIVCYSVMFLIPLSFQK